MIEALKALLSGAAQARKSGQMSDAERLYKEAAAQAQADETVERAEALTGIGRARRDANDRTGASIYYSEAITLLRNADARIPLARALRHAAEIRSDLGEYGVAATQIEEAIRLYRAFETPEPLHLANALRVSALNDERQAKASWTEARALYDAADVHAGVAEAEQHLEHLSHTPKINPHTRTFSVVKATRGTPTTL
jgi:tetratricopeptide (TPR) repeat protein